MKLLNLASAGSLLPMMSTLEKPITPTHVSGNAFRRIVLMISFTGIRNSASVLVFCRIAQRVIILYRLVSANAFARALPL